MRKYLQKKSTLDISKGITLMEVIIVIALISIVASFGLFISMDTYAASSFNDERDLLISALMHARAQAINNTCTDTLHISCTTGKPHGVHIDMTDNKVTQYVIFQGTTYDPEDTANEIIKVHHFVQSTGATDVSFAQLSGDVTASTTMILKSSENELSEIHIDNEGQINWTH